MVSAISTSMSPLAPLPVMTQPLAQGGVTDRSMFFSPGGGHVLVFFDPRIDPTLANWISGVRKRFASEPNSLSKMSRISKHVQRSFGRNHKAISRPFTRRKYHDLIQQSAVLLGDFLKIRSGGCLYASVALQIAFQQTILDESYQYQWRTGRLKHTVKTQVVYNSLHAWVMARDPSREAFLFDPIQGIHGERITGIPEGAFHLSKKIFLLGMTSLAYTSDSAYTSEERHSVYSYGNPIHDSRIEAFIKNNILHESARDILLPPS